MNPINPIEWLKLLYETFGVNHPKASMFVVAVLGALVFAGAWQFAAVQYHKDQVKQHSVPIVPPNVINKTTTITTSAPDSPITTGNGNSISYEDASPHKKGAAQPKRGNGP